MVDGKISRIEETPSFVRQDALDTLAASAPVQAVFEIERRRATAAAAAGRDSSGTGGSAGRGGAVASSWGSSWRPLDDDSSGAGSGGVAGSLASAAQTVSLAVRGLLESAGVLSPLPPGRTAQGGDDGEVDTHARGHASLVRQGPPTPSSPPSFSRVDGTATTSTGLSGVAAISHAVFAGRSAAGQPATASDGHGALAGGRRVVRTPDSYATITFAVRARAAAEREEAQRQAAAAAKEARLRAALAAQQEARAAAIAAAAAQAAGPGLVN